MVVRSNTRVVVSWYEMDQFGVTFGGVPFLIWYLDYHLLYSMLDNKVGYSLIRAN